MKNLPRINFKDRNNNKKGFLPWMRARLGLGGQGVMGTAGQGIPILGRTALGTAKFSGTSGLSALLAGKTAFVLSAAVITAAVGTAVYMKPAPPPIVAMPESAPGSSADYVPAALRQQNQGSALDLFSDTNKGLMSMEEPVQQEQPAGEPAGESAAPATPADVPAVSPAPVMTNMAEQMVAKLVRTPSGGGLAGVMGSGAGKFNIMGGGLGGNFGNNFGKGAALGGKSVGMGEIGSTFPVSRTFKQPNKALTKKVLAMKSGLRPVYSKPGGGKNATGKGAFSQAKGVKTAQRSYIGTNADAVRSTQDKAWEGSTTEGAEGAVAGGGSGLGAESGGTGIATSPSLDNIASAGDGGNTDDPVTSVSPPLDVSPWQGLPQLAMMLIMLSSMLSVIGAQLIMMSNQLAAAPDPTGSNQAAAAALKAFGMALCGVAIGLAGTATALGGVLSTVNGQAAMGGIYATGGGVATAAGVVAMTSDGSQAAAVSPSWMSGIAGVISLLGSMASTLVGSISTLAK
jgi:hypothetical protein